MSLTWMNNGFICKDLYAMRRLFWKKILIILMI